MAHLDRRSGELVIRIVYDGAPEAGKTTNITRLSSEISLQRRGALASPGNTGRRTEFFDWLDFSGGFIDGKRVRCQLVSVPGQPQLLHRRRYLLDTADVVVFVADSRADTSDRARENLARTRKLLAKRSTGEPVGVLLQANKRDLDDALVLSELAERLELPDTMPIVESVATEGDGVMQTFILAVRMATNRVRSMLLAGEIPDLPAEHETAEALLEVVERLRPDAPEIVPVPRLVKQQAEPIAPEPEAPEPEAPDANGPDANGPEAPNAPRAPRTNAPPDRLGGIDRVDLEISAGHVWPPVRGRALLSQLALDDLEAPAELAAWAPSGGFELRTGKWILHSSTDWLFADEARARYELLSLVKRQVKRLEILPPNRVFFVTGDGPGWRMWQLTSRVTTARDLADAAVGRRDQAALDKLLDQVARLMDRADQVDPQRERERYGGLSAIGVDGDKTFVLGLAGDHESEPPDAGDPLEQLRRLSAAIHPGDDHERRLDDPEPRD